MKKAADLLDRGMKALANTTRRRILAMLYKEPLNNNELMTKFNIAQSAMSRHTSILHRAGLVTTCKEGVRIWFSVNQPNVEHLFLNLRKDLNRFNRR